MARNRRRTRRRARVHGTHHTTRRRRRMGAVHPALKQTIELAAGAAVGAIAATFINQAVKTSLTSAPAWAGGAVSLVAGAAIPMFIKPSPLITGASMGLAGMGAVFIANETVLSLPGISGMPTGVPNATPTGPGYIRQSVNGYYRTVPANRIGNFSGSGGKVVNGVYSN